jgi:hypothetical protein
MQFKPLSGIGPDSLASNGECFIPVNYSGILGCLGGGRDSLAKVQSRPPFCLLSDWLRRHQPLWFLLILCTSWLQDLNICVQLLPKLLRELTRRFHADAVAIKIVNPCIYVPASLAIKGRLRACGAVHNLLRVPVELGIRRNYLRSDGCIGV